MTTETLAELRERAAMLRRRISMNAAHAHVPLWIRSLEILEERMHEISTAAEIAAHERNPRC